MERFANILFKEKQAGIILALADKSQKWYITNLSHSANVTYVHTSRFVARCEELGIIEAEIHGKMKTLRLTDKGQEIASSIISINSKLRKLNGDDHKAQKQQMEQQPK